MKKKTIYPPFSSFLGLFFYALLAAFFLAVILGGVYGFVFWPEWRVDALLYLIPGGFILLPLTFACVAQTFIQWATACRAVVITETHVRRGLLGGRAVPWGELSWMGAYLPEKRSGEIRRRRPAIVFIRGEFSLAELYRRGPAGLWAWKNVYRKHPLLAAFLEATQMETQKRTPRTKGSPEPPVPGEILWVPYSDALYGELLRWYEGKRWTLPRENEAELPADPTELPEELPPAPDSPGESPKKKEKRWKRTFVPTASACAMLLLLAVFPAFFFVSGAVTLSQLRELGDTDGPVITGVFLLIGLALLILTMLFFLFCFLRYWGERVRPVIVTDKYVQRGVLLPRRIPWEEVTAVCAAPMDVRLDEKSGKMTKDPPAIAVLAGEASPETLEERGIEHIWLLSTLSRSFPRLLPLFTKEGEEDLTLPREIVWLPCSARLYAELRRLYEEKQKRSPTDGGGE